MPSGESDLWFLAQVKPNSGRIAERALVRQGFGVFFPAVTHHRRRQGQTRQELRPLFPGYLFVSFDPDQPQWRAINSTTGISRLVQFGQAAPKPLPAALILGLQARCDDQGVLAPDNLREGDRVRVISGVFSDFVTTIEQIGENSRIFALMDLLGRQIRVGLDSTEVEKLPDSA